MGGCERTIRVHERRADGADSHGDVSASAHVNPSRFSVTIPEIPQIRVSSGSSSLLPLHDIEHQPERVLEVHIRGMRSRRHCRASSRFELPSRRLIVRDVERWDVRQHAIRIVQHVQAKLAGVDLEHGSVFGQQAKAECLAVELLREREVGNVDRDLAVRAEENASVLRSRCRWRGLPFQLGGRRRAGSARR